ncbi:MAG: hypothetical protein AMXMBFR6_20420 [Betaproteobacteria bacterium]
MDKHPLPPLHALIAYDALARLGSFSRDAEEPCITRQRIALALDVQSGKYLERGTLIRLFDIELASDRS